MIDSVLFLERDCFQKYVIREWFNLKILLLPYIHCGGGKPLWGKDVIIIEINGIQLYIVRVRYVVKTFNANKTKQKLNK